MWILTLLLLSTGIWAEEICVDVQETENSLIGYETGVGDVFFYAGNLATLPSNYEYCDGRTFNSVSDESLTELYAVIGTGFGGSSASSFSIPNMVSRFVQSRVSYAINYKSGAASVGLNSGTIPSHTHFFPKHQHTHKFSQADDNNHGGGCPDGCACPDAGHNGYRDTEDQTPLSATTYEGGNSGHQNMPPYFSLVPIIRMK
jgi:microcystin-dependent protein